ncbi:MAG: hypothetical protein HC945_01810 [Nitrosarchaeum sp.]|nr:hypothetical protein [Nitrosarchaeum sp.]
MIEHNLPFRTGTASKRHETLPIKTDAALTLIKPNIIPDPITVQPGILRTARRGKSNQIGLAGRHRTSNNTPNPSLTNDPPRVLAASGAVQ